MPTVTIDKDKIAKSALRYIQKGQLQKAIEEYRKALSADPKDIRLRLKLVDLYARSGKKKEAVEECVQVAESYSDQGFYLKAVAVYKQALRVDAENPQLHQSMGELYVKQGLLGDALGSLRRAVQLLRQQGRSAEAERLLSRMTEMAPENASVKLNLAELYLAEGKLDAFLGELDGLVAQLRAGGRTSLLLETLESLRKRAAEHPSVLQRLSEISDAIGREGAGKRGRPVSGGGAADRGPAPEGSATRSGTAFGRPGEGTAAALLEVDLYLKYGMEEKAAQRLHELARTAPESLPVRERLRDLGERSGDRSAWLREQLNVAELHLREGNASEAKRAYEAVLAVEPEHGEAAEGLRRLGNEAVWGTERPERNQPGGAPFSTEAAVSQTGFDVSELSEVDDIVREFKAGIADKVDASDYDTHYSLGMAYKEMGLLEDALEEFRMAARSPERSREAYTCMALVYRETGRLSDARAALRMALAATGNAPEDEVAILFELGLLAEEEQDWENALQTYTKAVGIDPGYRDVSRRLENLKARRGQ